MSTRTNLREERGEVRLPLGLRDVLTGRPLAEAAVRSALVSTASPMQFNDVARGQFDRVSRPGGGKQYIIATAEAPLLLRAALSG